MECQNKIINFLDNTSNQLTKFMAKKWVELNDDSRRKHNTNSPVNFKTSMLKSSLCDYSDEYILTSETITITRGGNDDAARQINERNKEVIFKDCTPFTDCISEINNIQIDNVEYKDSLISMYDLIKYSDNYTKTSGSLW